MGVIQAWVACAAVHAPVTGAGSGWTHFMAIIYRDAGTVGPIFLMEYFYGRCRLILFVPYLLSPHQNNLESF